MSYTPDGVTDPLTNLSKLFNAFWFVLLIVSGNGLKGQDLFLFYKFCST